jgi:hypothetical protein
MDGSLERWVVVIVKFQGEIDDVTLHVHFSNGPMKSIYFVFFHEYEETVPGTAQVPGTCWYP